MKNYYKIMLGPKSKHAEQCLSEGFIGAGYNMNVDLSNDLYDDWKKFNHKYIPLYLEKNPSKSKIAAGLACGALWVISKGIKQGDVIVSPNGKGVLHFGAVSGDYYYMEGSPLPHRRSINWFPSTIPRNEVSQDMKQSLSSQGTYAELTKHAEEIERYIKGENQPAILSTDPTIEDPTVFALEKHLEDFLVANWHHTILGNMYELFYEEGEMVGRQYPTDTGPIDILAISKDKKELLVVELKKGRASDVVVGQIQRYMGYVVDELAEETQTVKGVIIALEEDQKIRRALRVTNNIEFYRYQVSFKLFKV